MKILTTFALVLVAGTALAACSNDRTMEERGSYSDTSYQQQTQPEPIVRQSQSK